MKKIFFLLIIGIFAFQTVFANREFKDITYAQKDTCTLKMDVYYPENVQPNTPCIIFVFGGGFLMGSKSYDSNVAFCRAMSDQGFVTVAIDYRLGLVGVKNISPTNVKPLEKAIRMAVEDLYSATDFLIKNKEDYNVDAKKIILCGSSAGAITVLQADYELANRNEIAAALPVDFHYAGVISFAGAILTHEWKPDYRKHSPAPTMFFHGTDDKVVFYDKLQVLRLGFFGTNALVKRFEKFNYPYYAYRYRDMGHEIAEVPMTKNITEIVSFINDYVMEQRPLKTDITVKDGELKPYMKWKSHKDLY